MWCHSFFFVWHMSRADAFWKALESWKNFDNFRNRLYFFKPCVCKYIMASPGQKRGACDHLMAGFDQHSCCARCCDKGQVSDPCVMKQECTFCNALTPTGKHRDWPNLGFGCQTYWGGQWAVRTGPGLCYCWTGPGAFWRTDLLGDCQSHQIILALESHSRFWQLILHSRWQSLCWTKATLWGHDLCELTNWRVALQKTRQT